MSRCEPGDGHARRAPSAADRVGSTQETTHGAFVTVKDAALGTVSGTQHKVEVAHGRRSGRLRRLAIVPAHPASDKEARLAAQVVDTVRWARPAPVDDAKAAAQDVAHNLTESAGDAAATVKETATESARGVREEGRASADEVRAESGH